METDSVIHVAFADDHQIVRESITSMLVKQGGIAIDIEAENGQELLEKLESASVLPDICMIDISMPVMDGFTALLEIRKKWPKMKTLILTAFDDEMYVIRMIQAGANGYLLKKSSIKETKEAILSIYSVGYYYSENANRTLFHLNDTNSIKMQGFSEQEIEVLKYCCTELKYGEIAQKMNTTLNGIEGCRDRLFIKLKVNSRVGLALFAVRFGLCPLENNPFGKIVIPKLKNK